MRFYQSCFGGELHFRYLGESPFGRDLPEEMRKLIVQASLVSEHIRLFASDLTNEDRLCTGNSISLLISMSLGENMEAVFGKLSIQGEITSPLSPHIARGHWASLTDRYAVQWIFEAL
jgi:PhnB protein